MKKTVMEWLGDKKLYEKKITKLILQIRDTEFFIGKSNLYSDAKAMEEEMVKVKGLVDSYVKMKQNIDKIQEAIMQFNATHKIEICGQKITIAAALKMYREYDSTLTTIIQKNIIRSNELMRKLEDKQEKEVKLLEEQLNSSNKQVGNQAFEDKIKNKKADYEPVIKYAFDLNEKYKELTEKEDEFLQNVNTKINIANVQETLDIELD